MVNAQENMREHCFMTPTRTAPAPSPSGIFENEYSRGGGGRAPARVPFPRLYSERRFPVGGKGTVIGAFTF